MSSTDSTTDNSSSVVTTDNRQVVSDRAMAFGANSNIDLKIVPDEAFDLGSEALAYGQDALRTSQEITNAAFRTVGAVATQQQQNNQGDLVQILDKLTTYAIPAALIGFAILKVTK